MKALMIPKLGKDLFPARIIKAKKEEDNHKED
jgi:hypothetical protein